MSAGKPTETLEPPADRIGVPDLALIRAISRPNLGVETAPPGSSIRELGAAS